MRALSFSLRTINSDHSIIRWLASVACNDKLIIILFFEVAFKLINSQETGTNQRNIIIFKCLWRQRTKMTYFSHLYDLFCVSRVFYYKKKIISMPIGIRFVCLFCRSLSLFAVDRGHSEKAKFIKDIDELAASLWLLITDNALQLALALYQLYHFHVNHSFVMCNVFLNWFQVPMR